MPFTLNDLWWGLAVPLLAAAGLRLVLAWMMDRISAPPRRETAVESESTTNVPSIVPFENCLPLAIASAIGYFMLSLGPWVPDAHYEWLPLEVGIAVVVASVVGFLGHHIAVRYVLLPLAYGAVIGSAGYILMPTWADLSPAYAPYLLGWCVGTFLVSVGCEFFPRRGEWPFAVVWLGTCLAVSVVVALSESLRFAQIAGLTFGACVGLLVVGGLLRRELLSGLGLTLSVYLGGILLIAQVNSYSDVPFVSYWLPLVGPLASVAIGSLLSDRISSAFRNTLMILAAAIPSTVAVIMAIVATLPS